MRRNRFQQQTFTNNNNFYLPEPRRSASSGAWVKGLLTLIGLATALLTLSAAVLRHPKAEGLELPGLTGLLPSAECEAKSAHSNLNEAFEASHGTTLRIVSPVAVEKGGRVVAVTAAGSAQAPEYTVWWSTDCGRSPQSVDDDSTLPGADRLSGAVRLGEQFMVVGVLRPDQRPRATAWTTADGQHWSEVPIEQQHASVVKGITTLGDAAFAVGTYEDPGSLRIEGQLVQRRYEAAVWSTTNGLQWERLPISGPGLHDRGDQILRGVSRTEEGLKVRLDSWPGRAEGKQDDTETLTSVDGITWS